MAKLKSLLFLFALGSFSAFADKFAQNLTNSSLEQRPWFTGPIFTPSPITPQVGHPSFSLAWFYGETYGRYDDNGRVIPLTAVMFEGPYIDVQVGITKCLGVEFIGGIDHNWSGKASYVYPADSIVRMGYQLSTQKRNSWVPDCRILLDEIIPSGNYHKLGPENNLTDLTGQGSYLTGILIALQKLFHPVKDHDLNLIGVLGYFFPASSKVEGISFLGGRPDTLGTIFPGQSISGFLTAELGLAQTWSLCLESSYQFSHSGRFERRRGPEINVPSMTQIYLAPQIEHIFTRNFSTQFGGWFTVAGRNSFAFSYYFISLNYGF